MNWCRNDFTPWRSAAGVEPGRFGGLPRRARTRRGPASPPLAQDTDQPSGRFGILPGIHHEVVRGPRRRFRAGAGAQPTPGTGAGKKVDRLAAEVFVRPDRAINNLSLGLRKSRLSAWRPSQTRPVAELWCGLLRYSDAQSSAARKRSDGRPSGASSSSFRRTFRCPSGPVRPRPSDTACRRS